LHLDSNGGATMGFQFSLKRIFGATTLIALGTALAVSLLTPPYPDIGGLFVTWSIAGSLLGAGIFVPFKRTAMGTILGAIVPYFLLHSLLQGL
jgi:hypothetical protein